LLNYLPFSVSGHPVTLVINAYQRKTYGMCYVSNTVSFSYVTGS